MELLDLPIYSFLDLVEFLDMASLVNLRLTCSNIKNKIDIYVGKHMKHLDFSEYSETENKVVKYFYYFTKENTNIERLLLSGEVEESKFMPVLKRNKNLKVLSLLLYKESLSDNTVLKAINYCPNLTSLNLAYLISLTDHAVKVFCVQLPWLIQLNIYVCPKLTDVSVDCIRDGLPQLKRITLGGCIQFTESALQLMVRSCRNITHLNMPSVHFEPRAESQIDTRFPNDLIRCVGASLKKLEFLNVNGCNCIPYSFEGFAQNCRQVHTLLLDGNRCIDDDILLEFAMHLTQLEKLSLSYCVHIGNKGICCIAQNCKQLLYLDVTGCYNVDDESFIKLSEESKCLAVIYTAGCYRATSTGTEALASIKTIKYLG